MGICDRHERKACRLHSGGTANITIKLKDSDARRWKHYLANYLLAVADEETLKDLITLTCLKVIKEQEAKETEELRKLSSGDMDMTMWLNSLVDSKQMKPDCTRCGQAIDYSDRASWLYAGSGTGMHAKCPEPE